MPKPSEMDLIHLMLAIAEQEEIISNATKAKRELLAEVVARKDWLKDQYRKGNVMLGKDVEE